MVKSGQLKYVEAHGKAVSGVFTSGGTLYAVSA
jgi:hypothetical protein